MKRHVFKAIHQGWDKTTEGIWFDVYDYQGELFYEVQYLGNFDEDDMIGM